ncbi:MAG: prepilin-type N-terminal cleavage/methylation domain-containing protein [Planctomycetes bacterium]|nr:prepilin-type N-terminal cleavage/methylation domain-containing protein [Planctomycetota bacterium]
MRRHGFTLIELLVVVAIITLLIAILLPSLNQAKQSAKLVVCRSNMHQLGVAGLSYIADNFTQFPDAKLWVPDAGSAYHAWHKASAVTGGLLWAYAPNPDVYLCQSFKDTYAIGAPYWCGETSAAQVTPAFSCTMNAYLGWTGWLNQAGTTPVVAFARLGAIKRPAQTLYFGEENGWAQSGQYAAFGINNGMLGWRALVAPGWYPPDLFATYHLPPNGDVTAGCSNAVFIDGHAQLVWNYQTKDYAFDPMW